MDRDIMLHIIVWLNTFWNVYKAVKLLLHPAIDVTFIKLKAIRPCEKHCKKTSNESSNDVFKLQVNFSSFMIKMLLMWKHIF